MTRRGGESLANPAAGHSHGQCRETRSLAPFLRTQALGLGGSERTGVGAGAASRPFEAARPRGSTTSFTDWGAASSTQLAGRRPLFTSRRSFW